MARILVVDDERDLCELVRINLELDGHEVTTAHDGEQALARLAADVPDLVVLDVMMPGRDGFSVLTEMKASEGPLSTVPVLMLTARSDALDRIRGGIEGAVGYVTKPFSVDGLRDAVHDLLTGEPEPLRRRQVQTRSLAELARQSAPHPPAPPGAARPRLTRLEPGGGRPTRAASPLSRPTTDRLRAVLSERQQELVDAIVAAPTLSEAAQQLGVSRSYLYASLRRMARKVGVPTGPALVRLLRDEQPRP